MVVGRTFCGRYVVAACDNFVLLKVVHVPTDCDSANFEGVSHITAGTAIGFINNVFIHLNNVPYPSSDAAIALTDALATLIFPEVGSF
jgi:hypothetical protein